MKMKMIYTTLLAAVMVAGCSSEPNETVIIQAPSGMEIPTGDPRPGTTPVTNAPSTSTLVVGPNSVVLPNDGFYQIQRNENGNNVNIYEGDGRRTVTLDRGTYTIINHTTHTRTTVVIDGSDPVQTPQPQPEPTPTPTPQPQPEPEPDPSPTPEPEPQQMSFLSEVVGVWDITGEWDGYVIDAGDAGVLSIEYDGSGGRAAIYDYAETRGCYLDPRPYGLVQDSNPRAPLVTAHVPPFGYSQMYVDEDYNLQIVYQDVNDTDRDGRTDDILYYTAVLTYQNPEDLYLCSDAEIEPLGAHLYDYPNGVWRAQDWTSRDNPDVDLDGLRIIDNGVMTSYLWFREGSGCYFVEVDYMGNDLYSNYSDGETYSSYTRDSGLLVNVEMYGSYSGGNLSMSIYGAEYEFEVITNLTYAGNRDDSAAYDIIRDRISCN